jgi:hypothetical protein
MSTSLIATGRTLGASVAQAIGLPIDNLAGFTLSFQAEEAVRCTASYLLTTEDGGNLIRVIKTFHLVEADN